MNTKFKTRVVQFRRRREGKTNYKKRLNLLKSGIPRLVVRKSLNHVNVQIATFLPEGDKVHVAVNSKSLEKLGWPSKGNIPTAYLTGYMLGKKALEAGIKKAILDIGMQSPIKATRVYAALKGACDAGLDVPHSEDVMPDDEKVAGKDIEEYAKLLKEKDDAKYKRQFSKYIKEKVDPSSISSRFEEVKNKITGAK